MEWINVKNKLPKENKLILVYNGKEVIPSFYYKWSGLFVFAGIEIKNVTCWQSAPAPPKETK